jgi:S1-C subfamily serine protease
MAKSTEGLQALSNSMADAVEIGGASTVTVKAGRRFPSSGVATSKDLVLAASHSIRDEGSIQVTLADGTELAAELLGRDPNSDLALMRLSEAKAAPARVAKADPKVGQIALALGRPSAEGVQASFGIVSAIGGPTYARHGGLLEAHLRTDAIPFPGFSGGPLMNAEGQLIGINTSSRGRGHSITIPVQSALKIAASIEEHGGVKRGFLGIRGQLVEIPEDSQEALGREQATGLLLARIESDSPAATSDLMVGDIVVGFNKQPVKNHDELLALLNGEVVDKPTPVEVLRGGKRVTVDVTIGERVVQEEHSHSRHRWHGKRMWRGPWGRRRRR